MKIGIYGGTFNPPHLGHFEAAKAAIDTLGLDKLLLIPDSVPPHKDMPDRSPDGAHRLEMTRLMADALQKPGVVEVSDLEMERAGKSYTSDTLAQIHAQYPEAELWLLMGTDMYLTLHQWHEPEKVLKLARVCAFGRAAGDTREVFDRQVDHLAKTYGAVTQLITIPNLVEVSSTQLREQLAAGQGGADLLPAVYGYILRKGLYGTHADLTHLDIPELRACSYSMVKQKRVPHIRGTEEEAMRLARRWGADEKVAQRAAILHDCTKYLSLEEHLALCRQYGVETDELEQRAVKLLHAKTGACIAKYVFGESDEVYEAIFWHTTAKADMTLMEKILYMADYIEPNRAFDGVDEMRRLAYTDLDRAMLMGIEDAVEEMTQRGYPIHKSSVQAQAWFRSHGSTDAKEAEK